MMYFLSPCLPPPPLCHVLRWINWQLINPVSSNSHRRLLNKIFLTCVWSGTAWLPLASIDNSHCKILHCFVLIYTKFCIGFKIRKSRCRTTLTLRFGSLKMIFECSIARCDVGLGRAIVQCQKNPLRKPKLSINRAILSAHFSAVKFCIGFFCWIGFFLVLHRLFL